MNCTISDRATACLIQCGLPPAFWNYAVIYALYLIHCTRTRALPNGTTPYKMLTGVHINASKFKVFGCVAYCRPLLQSNLQPGSEKCIFFRFTSNGCKVLNL